MKNKKATRALTLNMDRKILPKSKRSQEEMVGFALIIIIVAVILLIFLSLSLRNPEKEAVESYEVDSFIQSLLQYHTTCRDYSGYLDVRELIFSCDTLEVCLDEQNSCEVLNSTLEGIVEESWRVSEQSPVKGYELNILVDSREILKIEEGNVTNSYKGSMQLLGKNNIKIFFRAYY